MTSRTRLWVLAVSTPVIAFAVIGGYLGRVIARDETYQHLRVFDDVVQLVVENYVEEVDVAQAMRGAMRGLSDGLDADSAYLTADLVKTYDTAGGAADVGLDVIRQYYLRVVAAREGSPAAKAGLRTGDYIRAIDGRPTRDMSAYEGERLLQGAPGSKVTLLVIRGNAADPHEVALVRERVTAPALTSRVINGSIGYVHVVEFGKESSTRVKQAFDSLAKSGATRYVVDLRGSAWGDLDDGLAAARLFVKSGTLTIRQTKTQKEPIAAQANDASIGDQVVLLIDQSTTGAAELFAAALDGNNRAELIGEHTLGRVARQQLVKLPDGSGLLLSSSRYLTPSGDPLHEKGLTPDVEVEEPEVDFGVEPPAGDATLDKAVERLSEKKAA